MARIPKAALLRAEEAIAATIAQADHVVSLRDPQGRLARAELLEVLEAADRRLAKRLLTITPKPSGEMRFTAAQAIAYRTQIGLVIEHVKGGIEPIAVDVGDKAISKAMRQGTRILAKLEHEFKGVSTSPSLIAAMQQSHVRRGPEAALVTRVATSLDRYGLEMGQQFSRILQVGLVSGATTDQMVASLVAHGGPRGRVSLAAREIAPGVVQRIREGDIPEGLFVRHRYWAERIIRTETAYAYNGTKHEQLVTMRAEGLDVRKKIVAHFDNRTAPDSVAVHGQIRELDQTFVDGAGRVYLYPPGRPNDRETILPWFDDWRETPSSEPPSPTERDEAVDLATPKPPGEEPPVTKPTSPEEITRLEDQTVRARREREEQERRRKADEETRAAEVLERLRREKEAKASELAALARKAEEDRLRAAEEAARKAREALDRSVRKTAEKAPHEAALDLYEAAGAKPRTFGRLVNYHRTNPLPEDAIVRGISDNATVLDTFVRDVLGTYTDPNALDVFKRGPDFGAYVDRLAAAGDARSRRRLAALVHSEQALFVAEGKAGQTWAASGKLAKERPEEVARRLRARYAPPKDYALKYRDLYGPELAARMGEAERRTDAALALSLPEAIKIARDKLPKETGTLRYLEQLAVDQPKLMAIREARTLGEMVRALSFGEDLRAHVALVGHVRDLEQAKPRAVIKGLGQRYRSKDLRKQLLAAAKRGAEVLAKLIHADLALIPEKVFYSGSGRESASGAGIFLTERSAPPVVAHELAHRIDMKTATGYRAEAFLQARGKGKAVARLNEIFGVEIYEDHEVAYRDAGFLHPYTGKIYGRPASGATITEVTTMGVQYLLEGDALRLYNKDPDHFWFTLSQLR